MNDSLWTKLVLSNLQFYQWRGGSYLYGWVGLVQSWRESSWLLQQWEILGGLLISLVLVLAPFVSTSLIGLLLLACGGYWVLLTVSDTDQPGASSIHLLVLLYWFIATVATAFSPVKLAAFSGWIKLTLYLFFFALSSKVFRSGRMLGIVITILLHVALVVSIYGVRQEFFGVEQLATWNDPNSPLAQDTRVYSYLGNPNLLAGYLLGAIALSLAAVFIWRGLLPKALAGTMVLVNSACLYFTDSRGGWIGMVVLILTFLLLLRYWFNDLLSPFWRTWLLPMIIGGLAGFLIVAVLLVEPLRLRVYSLFDGRNNSTNNFRINVWEAVFEMIRDRPILGIGPGNSAFNKIYPLYMRPNYSALSAYSIFLETIVETGILGLSCFVWLVTVTFHRGMVQLERLRQEKNNQGLWAIAAIAAMAAMLAQGIGDTVWYRPQINTLWWLMVGIIASQYRTDTGN